MIFLEQFSSKNTKKEEKLLLQIKSVFDEYINADKIRIVRYTKMLNDLTSIDFTFSNTISNLEADNAYYKARVDAKKWKNRQNFDASASNDSISGTLEEIKAQYSKVIAKDRADMEEAEILCKKMQECVSKIFGYGTLLKSLSLYGAAEGNESESKKDSVLAPAARQKLIKAPFIGTVLRHNVANGSIVSKGDTVMTFESTGNELEFKATASGTIHFVLWPGDQFQAKQVVATIAVTANSIPSKQNDKNVYVPSKIASVFGWLWCAFLAFFGLSGIITGDFILGSIVIAAGLVVCPKINPHFKMKWKFFLSIILLLVGFFIFGTSNDDSSTNKDEIQTMQSQQTEESISIPEVER